MINLINRCRGNTIPSVVLVWLSCVCVFFFYFLIIIIWRIKNSKIVDGRGIINKTPLTRISKCTKEIIRIPSKTDLTRIVFIELVRSVNHLIFFCKSDTRRNNIFFWIFYKTLTTIVVGLFWFISISQRCLSKKNNLLNDYFAILLYSGFFFFTFIRMFSISQKTADWIKYVFGRCHESR